MKLRFSIILMVLWASVVSLMAETVNLNFFVDGEKILTKPVTAGSTYTLSTIISDASINMTSYQCRDYTFQGWKVGSPVEGDETPTMPATVTPVANVNLYAVFEKATTNRYVRVTTLDNLENDANYLIVCYYVYGGEQQYYALSNVGETYRYNNNTYNNITAERIFPRGGVITEPEDELVWTLKNGASAGTWRWYNADADKWLRVRDNRDYTMLTGNEGNATSCAITVANGIFTIKNNGSNRFFKYVDDDIASEDDYFITGTEANDYVIYLYKKESPFTSNPDCDRWVVYLDAVDGTITGKTPVSPLDTLTETAAGGMVTLPEAEMPAGTCTGWSFAGWHIDSPIEGTSSAPTLHAAGTYDPLYNGVTLHAVYSKSVTVTDTRTMYDTTYVKRTSTLQNGKQYIIVYNDGANNYPLGNSQAQHNYYTAYYVVSSTTPITVTNGEIVGGRSSSLEWTWDSSNNRFRNVGAPSQYIYPRTGGGGYSTKYYVLGDAASLTVIWDGDDKKWAIYKGDYNLSYYEAGNFFYTSVDATNYEAIFDIYEKVITSRTEETTITATTYNSYPHCTNYTVTLHGCGGTIGGENNVDVPESTPGGGVPLPAASPICGGEWSFVGWFEGEDKESFIHVEFTDFHAAGTRYYPKHDHEHLYAVYQRYSDRYRMVTYPNNMVPGDKYILTYYTKIDGDDDNTWDVEITSDVVNTNYLAGVPKEAPQDAESYYMIEEGTKELWVLGGSEDAWTFRNVDNGEYLYVATYDGYVRTSEFFSTEFKIRRPSTSSNLQMYIDKEYGDPYEYYFLRYDGSKFSMRGYDEFSYTSGGNTYNRCGQIFLYRQMKEYTSWPHCDPFTVYFDACGGTADDATLTESAPYAGITLPHAYANSDCSKEGWTFAGWATAPVTEETDLMTFDLLPADVVYHPLSTSTVLYAVYTNKTNQYKRIATVERLHTGVNYIIATDGNKALLNTNASSSTVSSASVSPNAQQIITNENDAIDWRLDGLTGEYTLYNVARDVFLDLRSAKAQVQKSDAVATHDNFQISFDHSTDKYSIYSNMSIVNESGNRYLGFSSTTFNVVASGSTPTLYFYRQQANYCSYPSCIDEMDAIAWAKVDGTFNSMTLESYNLKGAPDVNNSSGSPELQSDGTWLVKFNNSVLAPFDETVVQWDGTNAKIKIPYIVSDDVDLTSFLDTDDDRSHNDVYVMPGNTLTIDATDTLHTLTVPDGATLNVANSNTLTVNSLVLFSEGDRSAPVVNVNASGAIVLKNGELYHDRRIDENRYYWFTLPYDSKLKEISYSNVASNAKIPAYRTDYWVKYYDGASRAADANGGMQESSYWTHVAPKKADYTMKAGQGYIIGIADQATTKFGGQDYYHTKRIMRFTMRPDKATWLTQEQAGGAKVATVTPSTVEDTRNAVHAGWNLIGNPYLHTYNTGSVTGNSGLRNGAWVKELDDKDDWTGWWIVDGETTTVPYLTLYNPAPAMGEPHYTQVLASNRDLRPFEAVFIQVNDNSTINFMPTLNISAMPAYMRLQEEDAPVRTGITLTGADRTDATGFVISEEYSADYEIGADLAKMTNKGTLNLYTINADEQLLAFNGLSEEDAATPIPVGVQFHADGEYTFAFDAEHYNGNAISEMLLIDYVENTTTNLLYSNYTFVANRGTNNQRFAIVIRLAQAPQVTTDIDNFNSSDAPRKVIRDGHLFILREDDMYDAVGTRIR